MGQIIDAEYKEVAPLEEKGTDVLAAEVNVLFSKAETIAAASVEMLVEAGKRLRVVKGRIGHGEWLDWVENNLTFNKSKAAYIMKLAEKSEKEGGVFSNFQTFGNIGISKILALLEAPEEVAKEVVETVPVEDVTVRELKEELRKTKEENEALCQAGIAEQQKAEDLEKEVVRIKSQLEMAQKQKRRAEEQAAAVPDASELEVALEVARKELKEYKAKVKMDQDRVKAKAEKEAREAAQRELDDKMAELDSKIKTAEDSAKAEAAEEIEDLQKEISRLQKLSDPATGEFRAHVDSLQKEFDACLGVIEKAAAEHRDKWRAALKKVVVEVMGGQL